MHDQPKMFVKILQILSLLYFNDFGKTLVQKFVGTDAFSCLRILVFKIYMILTLKMFAYNKSFMLT